MTGHFDISALTRADKVALGSGEDYWTTRSVDGIPSLTLSDGPHGVRRQTGATDNLGIAGSAPATCFPPAVGLGQSWDVDVFRRVGEALGREARALGVDVLLGPAVNIKRDPRGGRNFEYLSEDPVIAGHLGASWVNGLQSTGVGASLKHFALNNQEHDRMRSSSDVDPRPLREIYLRAFSHIVRKANPWTVMCSYNKVNGVYASESRWLLTEVLRTEWGFDGVVVSDWGAVANRAAAAAAGLDLEMPGRAGATDAEVMDAIDAGELGDDALDRTARAMAGLADRVRSDTDVIAPLDFDAHHRLAREVAARSIVLLKNDDVLPLDPDRAVAIIGQFAESPRYQGGGSSHVNPTHVDIPLEEFRQYAHAATFSRGYATTGEHDDSLHGAAVAAAAEADAAVVFLGLDEELESEGFDRDDIELPVDQIALVSAVVAVQPRTVVVLSHGGVLRLQPIVDVVPAILDGALLGQAGGGAIADVVFGSVNPSGRLTETVPLRLQDTPAFLDFPGENSHVRYGEGLHVGYRWYDARQMDVTYPFGHGLSYTNFEFSDLSLGFDGSAVTVGVTVSNSGTRVGRETVQVYVAKPDSAVARPPRELKGFAMTADLSPSVSERVSVIIDRSELAHWDTALDGWVVEAGEYEIHVGASSRDIRASGSVAVTGDPRSSPITLDSTIEEGLADPETGAELENLMASMSAELDDSLGIAASRMLASVPIGRLAHFGVPTETLRGIVGRSD